jgi:ATP-dependent Clp protease ATP-binding subunit ClpA
MRPVPAQMLLPEEEAQEDHRRGEIEDTIATMARIPPKTVSKDPTRNCSRQGLDVELKRVVFGQDQAIDSLSSAIKLARAGLREPDKPIGCYLFSGPPASARPKLPSSWRILLGVEMLRFDMSEYMERHTVSRLIGAPPGYVGFDQGGLLTDGVDQHPYCVLLLDEIEKAHPDLFNILLQVMDHGKLTDHNGKSIDFRNVILIMTTNAGAAETWPRRRSALPGPSARATIPRRSTGCSRRSSATVSMPSFRSATCRRKSCAWWCRSSCMQLEAQLDERQINIELSDEQPTGWRAKAMTSRWVRGHWPV